MRKKIYLFGTIIICMIACFCFAYKPVKKEPKHDFLWYEERLSDTIHNVKIAERKNEANACYCTLYNKTIPNINYEINLCNLDKLWDQPKYYYSVDDGFIKRIANSMILSKSYYELVSNYADSIIESEYILNFSISDNSGGYNVDCRIDIDIAIQSDKTLDKSSLVTICHKLTDYGYTLLEDIFGYPNDLGSDIYSAVSVSLCDNLSQLQLYEISEYNEHKKSNVYTNGKTSKAIDY